LAPPARVLTTNTELPTAEVAQTYKSLWRVERPFREQKSTLEVLMHQWQHLMDIQQLQVNMMEEINQRSINN
jgi:hypothetical protein